MRPLCPSSVVLLLLLVVLCYVLPSVVAPPPPPPPRPPHQPDAVFHGWAVGDIECDPNSGKTYILDGSHSILSIDQGNGKWVYANRSSTTMYYYGINADSRGLLYVSAWSSALGPHLLVLNTTTQPMTYVRVIRTEELIPPLYADVQVVTDSSNNAYLSSTWIWNGAGSNRVWVLDNNFEQVDNWLAPVPVGDGGRRPINATAYLMGIDSQDMLYFQQQSLARRLYTVTKDGKPQDILGLFDYLWWSDLRPTDIAVDAAGYIYLIGYNDPDVFVFSPEGYWSDTLSVLGDGVADYRAWPAIDIDNQGRVQVVDPYNNEVLVLSPRGDITHAYASDQATLTNVRQILLDPATGDLIVSNSNAPVIAQRISAFDGSLIQEYKMPGRLTRDYQCYSQGMDIGKHHGRLYALLQCYDSDYYSLTFWLHILQRDGRVVGDFRLPTAQGEHIRVDESARRIYVAAYNWTNWQSVIEVFDMSAQLQSTITPSSGPPFDYIADLLVAPDGSHLIVVDSRQQRVVGIAFNGTILWQWTTGGQRMYLYDLAFAADNTLFFSSTYWFPSSDGSWWYNSTIYRVDYYGQVMDTYVGMGTLPIVGGAQFGALAVNNRGLFAYDLAELSMYVWYRDMQGDIEHTVHPLGHRHDTPSPQTA